MHVFYAYEHIYVGTYKWKKYGVHSSLYSTHSIAAQHIAEMVWKRKMQNKIIWSALHI